MEPLAAASEESYFVAYRAPSHISYSSPDVFHDVADQLQNHLVSKQVMLRADPERNPFHTSELFSTESLLKLAKEAGASHLLYLTVERPTSKWIKLTLQCFDSSGKLLWEEMTQNGGGFSGKGGVRKALEQMKQKLDARLGGPGLPVAKPVSPAVPEVQPDPSRPQAGL